MVQKHKQHTLSLLPRHRVSDCLCLPGEFSHTTAALNILYSFINDLRTIYPEGVCAFADIKEAFKAARRAQRGSSDHIAMMLTPVN